MYGQRWATVQPSVDTAHTHTLALSLIHMFVEMKANSNTPTIQHHCRQVGMYTVHVCNTRTHTHAHMECVCVSSPVSECVWGWTRASVFSQQSTVLQKQSQLQERLSEWKFHLTITPRPLADTSEHFCFLSFFFSLTTPPCFLSEGLSLLWFIKRNSKYRGTWWIYVSWPHKQQVLYVMTMLTPCVCSDGQRNLHSILLWGISILLSSRVTWNSATVGWLLICICKQLWRASGSVSQYQQTKNLQYQNVNGVKAERQK